MLALAAGEATRARLTEQLAAAASILYVDGAIEPWQVALRLGPRRRPPPGSAEAGEERRKASPRAKHPSGVVSR